MNRPTTRPRSRCVLAIGDCEWEPYFVSVIAHPVSSIETVRRCFYLVDAISACELTRPDALLVSASLHDLHLDSMSLLHELKVSVIGVASNDAELAQLNELGLSNIVKFDVNSPQQAVSDVVDYLGASVPTNTSSMRHSVLGRSTAGSQSARESTGGVETSTDTGDGARPSQMSDARLIAAFGTHGAPGRTSIAIGVADELARSGTRTLLIDADLGAPSIGLLLGLSADGSGLASACRLVERGAFNEESLRHVAHSISDNLQILTGETSGITTRHVRVASTTEVILRSLDFMGAVVLDLSADTPIAADLASRGEPSPPEQLNAAVLSMAHEILVCGLASPLGTTRLVTALGELQAFMRQSEAPTGANVRVVLNRCPKQRVRGLVNEVRQVLRTHAGTQRVEAVVQDRRAFERAVAGAETLAQASPRSSARRNLRELSSNLS